MHRAVAAIVACVFSLACTTQTTLRTMPPDATVTINGRQVSSRTPYRVKASKLPFALGETVVEVTAEGYQADGLTLEQIMDDNCLLQTSVWSIVGGLLIALPIVGLLYLPWCTEFEQDGYEIQLKPERSPVAGTALRQRTREARSGNEGQRIAAAIREHCSSKWPSSPRNQGTCTARMHSAWREVTDVMQRYSSHSAEYATMHGCWSEWYPQMDRVATCTDDRLAAHQPAAPVRY